MGTSDLGRTYVRNSAGAWVPAGLASGDSALPVVLTNPNAQVAGLYGGVTSYGYLRATGEPSGSFSDAFDTLDSTNRWTLAGTVNPTLSAGRVSLSPSTTASASSSLVSLPSFPPNGLNFNVVGWVASFENISAAPGTLFTLNNHRFAGLGSIPATWVAAYTASAATGPLLDAIGFEIDVDGKMYPVVYANGVRVRPALSLGGTDINTGNGSATTGGQRVLVDGTTHQFAVIIRADVIFWYVDGLDIPVASYRYSTAGFAMPNVQTLSLRYHSINATSSPGTAPVLAVGAVGVGDTGHNGAVINDGTYPWRKAKVDTYGSQNMALQGLAGAAAAMRPDSYLKVAQDASPLLAETFDAATLDVTDRWTTGGVTPTTAAGTLTVNPATTALAVSSLTSKASFPLLGNMFNQTLSILKVDSGLKTGNYRFTGVGNATGSPTVAAPVQDGVGFEFIDTTGVLSGVVWSGGVRLQSVSLAAFQPTDGAFHRYAVYFKTSRVYFEIDNVSVASIANPNPNLSNLPLLTLSVNGASTVSPAAVMQSTFLGIADSSRNNHFISDASFPWRKAQVGKSGGVSVKGAWVAGVSTNLGTSTGTVGPVEVSEAGNVTVIVKNTVAASAWAGAPVLVFEQSDDSTSWSPLMTVRSDTNAAASTHTLGAGAANAELMFDAALEGVAWVRVRCTTAASTNAMTVSIQPGGGFFSPLVTAVVAGPGAAAGNGPAAVTAAVTDTLIAAANGLRRGITVYNDSTATLYLSLGTAAASTTAFTIKMSAGGYYEVPYSYTGQIRGIWSSATGAARVTEVIA